MDEQSSSCFSDQIHLFLTECYFKDTKKYGDVSLLIIKSLKLWYFRIAEIIRLHNIQQRLGEGEMKILKTLFFGSVPGYLAFSVFYRELWLPYVNECFLLSKAFSIAVVFLKAGTGTLKEEKNLSSHCRMQIL